MIGAKRKKVEEVLLDEDDKGSVSSTEPDYESRLIITKRNNQFEFQYIGMKKISEARAMYDKLLMDLRRHLNRGTFGKVTEERS